MYKNNSLLVKLIIILMVVALPFTPVKIEALTEVDPIDTGIEEETADHSDQDELLNDAVVDEEDSEREENERITNEAENEPEEIIVAENKTTSTANDNDNDPLTKKAPKVPENVRLNSEINSTSVALMAISTPGYYEIDPDAIIVPTQLQGQSTNVHTKPHMLWANGDKVYVAVKATHKLDYMTLNGVHSVGSEVYDPWVSIYVDGMEYTPDGLTGNTKDAHWTVFEFNMADLQLNDDGTYPFFVKGIGGGHDVGGDLLFEIPKTAITANKIWIGGTERPPITLQLIAQVANEEKKVLETANIDGSETHAWTHTWTEVPAYDPYGREYTFTADEETVPVNFEKSIDGLTVTNTYNPDTIEIPVSKEWIGPAADTVTITLLADGVDTGKIIELNQGNNWSSSFKDLHLYDDHTGEQISYTVEEVMIPGFTSEKSGSIEEGFTFTNTNDATIDIDVKKKWIGPATASVTIKLFADQTEVGELLLNANNAWSGTFQNVRKYDQETGETILYTVEEVGIPGYTTVQSGSVEVGFTFTNINDATIDIDVEKRWIGPKVGPVTIMLFADGSDTGKTILLSEDNHWFDSFKDVRKYDAETGAEISYTVEEIEVPQSYKVDYSEEDGKIIVTNTARYGSLTVAKVDENDEPLAGATFELLDSNGDHVSTMTTGAHGTITFENLEWGDYTLIETKSPAGYNKLVKEITITINAEYLHVTKEIINTPIEWELPKTGGIGTIGFYAIGLVLMTVALWLISRRREA